MRNTKPQPHNEMQIWPNSLSNIALVYTLIAGFLGLPGVGWLAKHFWDKRQKRLRESAVAAKIAAEARQLDGTTVRNAYEQMQDLHFIIRDLNLALTKEIKRADRAELDRDDNLRKYQNAAKDSETADVFMRQMRAACRLAHVNIADYLPAEIKKTMEEMGIGYDS